MNVEETLRMHTPNWIPASDIREGDTISVWGNWKVVTRIVSINDGKRLEFFYQTLNGSEKSVKCYPDDIVAKKATT